MREHIAQISSKPPGESILMNDNFFDVKILLNITCEGEKIETPKNLSYMTSIRYNYLHTPQNLEMEVFSFVRFLIKAVKTMGYTITKEELVNVTNYLLCQLVKKPKSTLSLNLNVHNMCQLDSSSEESIDKPYDEPVMITLTENVLTVKISDLLKEELYQKITSCPISPYDKYENFKDRMISIFKKTPLFDALKDFNVYEKNPAAILLSNLPHDLDIPPTPNDGGRSNKTTFVSEGCLVGVGHMLGEAFAFKQEKNGELIQNICPIKGREKSHSNAGSNQILDMHNELSFTENRPHFLLLYCVRGDPKNQAITFVSDIVNVYEDLDDETIEHLRQKWYVTKAPESFGDTLKEQYELTSLLRGSIEMPELCLNFDTIQPLNEKASKSVKLLKDNLYKKSLAIHLKESDMILINNKKACHARNTFHPMFNGLDRWLQRLTIRNDLWEKDTDPKPPTRILINP